MASAIRHPRLRYVLDVIGQDLGYRFRFHNDRSLLGSNPPRYLIHYGGESKQHALPHHPLLAGKHPTPGTPHPATQQCPDLLARIFFSISRYEEYGTRKADTHGRFPAGASQAVAQNYLDRPVVREWTAEIGRLLRCWFPDLPPPTARALEFQPTYDIDLLWAYHHRGWRGIASGIKDAFTGHHARALSRLRVHPRNDPFFTVSQLQQLHRHHGLTATYFWLLADGSSRKDPNPYPVPGEQQSLMQSLMGEAHFGIHPGYESSVEESLITSEKERLEKIVSASVTQSRQHFLRFSLPETYRALLAAGITDDHSMGYADRAGWRAGTNLPFPWYDLERECTTELTVHPFAAMDIALKNYEGLGPGGAGAKILGIAEGVREYGGPFPLLWHNSSFADEYGWAGWRDMYHDLVSNLVAMGASAGQSRSKRSSTPG